MTDFSSKSFSTANPSGTQTQLIVYNYNTETVYCLYFLSNMLFRNVATFH